MRIYLRNRSPVLSQKEAKYSTSFMASLIMSRQLIENLTIYIEFTENCVDADTGQQIQGDVIWLDDNAYPREFKIRINKTTRKKKQLLALAHEIVHVKQYALNEMKDTVRGPSNVKWKKEYVHENKIDYFDLPWEIEAYGRENGMYIRYLEHKRKEKLAFD